MIISTIDGALEALIREQLPLEPQAGDVSFDPPSGTWSAQLNRITVNLFLFGVGRSGQPPRPALDRPGGTGSASGQRRPPLPMLQLNYLVTAWAGAIRDEHQLIGDLISCFLLHQALPARLLSEDVAAAPQLAVAHHDNSRAKDVWSTVGGTIKPSFELVVTTPIDALPFEDLAPRVERIRAMVAPQPAQRLGGGA